MFSKYLQSSSVLFAVCADGTRYSAGRLKTLDLKSYSSAAPAGSNDALQSIRLRGIIYQLLHRGLDVALLNGLEFQDSKVFAFVVERSQKPSSQSIRSEVTDLLVSSPLTDSPRHAGSTNQLADIIAAIGPASTRLALTLATLKRVDDKFLNLFPACVAHALLLDSVPLINRRFAAVHFDDQTESAVTAFIDSWSDQLCQNIDSWTGGEAADSSLVDIFDGRMFRQILLHSTDSLPAALTSRLSPLLRIITSHQPLPATDDAHLMAASAEVSDREGQYGRETSSQPSSIMPFSHPAFDKHLQEIHVIVKEASNQQLQNNKLSEELTHWHNAKKPLLIKRNAPQDPIAKKRLMRSNQRFMAEMLSYAASLTSTTGKSLTPELILVGASNASAGKTLATRGGELNGSISDKPKTTLQKTSRQAPGKIKNDKFATEAAKRAEAANTAVFGAWTRTREALDTARSPQERYIQTKRYLADVTERKDISVVINDVEMYKLSALLEIWANYCRPSKKKEGFYVAALIYDALTSLSKSTLVFPRDAAKILTNVVSRMGFDLNIKPGSLIEGGRPLSFSFDHPHGLSLSIDADPTTFRLAQTGPYMDRSMDSKQDDRVSFVPDGWQRKVLNALDASRSILVVAPTSSGKTFISFYAMEKVLRANDEDVVVYVAPTKALVNQVAAEVIARFNKNYKYPGTSIYAIHTRDYRVNVPTQCQVLITVPHILQIMLLSPANQKWVPRVKTIIFDEVHTINQADDGVVWEQLLLMAPCQIIALSATVGNTEAFSDWLSSTQSTSGRQFEVVEHEHRFSDLRKYIFESSRPDAFSGLPEKPQLAPLGLEDVETFTYLHPVRSLREGRVPTDLALESRDCLLLWQAMRKFNNASRPLPSDLAPSKFFSIDSISKSDIIAWGEGLKSELAVWMKNSEIAFKQVLDELGKDLPSTEAVLQLKPSAKTDLTNTMNGPEPDIGLLQDVTGTSETGQQFDVDAEDSRLSSLLMTTLPLLCSLRSSNALPAILFNYNRSSCEEIVRFVQNELVQAELAFKKNDPVWKAKIKAFDDWKERTAKLKAKDTKSKKPAKGDKADREGTSKLDLARESAGSEDRSFDGFDPLAPIDAFSFADPKKSNREELDKFVDYFRWRGIDERLIDAFQRGIGVHHAGMNRKYRQAVEICFRRGFLTVVVATGTLSLGINMPCKTVVFSGDSVFLTALNFRQASGRAGRRGFDLLGNVVFQQITVDKACRLLSSRLPDLNGHFPLTTSFILRLLGLLHGTNNAPYAMQMVNSLLSHPRLYLGGDSFRHQVLHHVRFSIEYLRSQGLVGAKGQPLNLSSCVSHLYFVEKGAFAFHALFREGVFHQLSEKMATNEIDTLRSLMLIMSHLFGRVPMRAVDKESEKELIKRSASVVFLPKMPQDVASVLNKHNTEILATYQLYVETYIDQNCDQPNTTLPFTKVSVEPNRGAEAVSLTTNLPPTKLRSPFVALSGQGDHFDSISDLCGSVRDGVFLEKAVIPYLDMGEELSTPLNAYLYDFYQHGQVQSLEVANGIRRGEVWFVLKDFSLVLATLVASLENFFKAGDNLDLDLSTVGAVSDEIELEMDASEEKLDSSSENGSKSVSTAATSITDGSMTKNKPERKQKARKAKVVDSWDDSGDESSSEDNDGDTGSEAAQENGDNMDEMTERKLKKVLVMFKKLQVEFDTKFRKIFA
jgi:superfamily II RNA helicase